MNGYTIIVGALERLALKAGLAVGGSYYEPCELTGEQRDKILDPVSLDLEQTADLIMTIAESYAAPGAPPVARAVVFDSRKNNRLPNPC